MKRNKYANFSGKTKKRDEKSLNVVSSNVSYWSQIFGLPDLKPSARVTEHKSSPFPRQQRGQKEKKKEGGADLLSPKNQLKKKIIIKERKSERERERPSDPTTKSHGFLPLQLSITGEVVNVVNE